LSVIPSTRTRAVRYAGGKNWRAALPAGFPGKSLATPLRANHDFVSSMARFPTQFASSPVWLRALLVSLALAPCAGWGSLTWEAKLIQQLAKPGDQEVITAFNFKNTGNTPVTIRDIQTSCSCTVAELVQRTYAPGEGGSIKTTFTVGARSGRQEKQITVTTDDPYGPAFTLTLQIQIKELLAFSTRMLRWKVGSAPEEQFIEITVLEENRITSLELQESSPKEQARVRIVPVEPGVKYRLFVQPAAEQARTVTLTFVAHFEGGAQRTFAVFALIR